MGLKVVVVGAGIGGLTAAVALRRVGFDVTVYERAAELREVGAGISLWANALRALDHLGAGDAVRAVCQPMVRSEVRVRAGHAVAVRYRAEDFERKSPARPFVGMCHRADLVGALAGRLPPEVVRFGHTFTGFDDTGRRVRASFANGHADEADVLVGADGLNSRVRAGLVGEQPPRFSGYTCWRGICPRPAALQPGDAGEWWGRGTRFGITTLPRDRVYWYASANAPQGQTAADEKAAVAERFAGWADPVPELIASTPPAAVLRNDIMDRPPARPWTRGRVVLLGDAAHPTTPNFGQGGCQAIEDGVVLARHLGRATDVPAALAGFEAERFDRTRAITEESWRFGRVGQWEGRLACGLRDRLMRVLLPLVASRSLPKYARFDVGPLSEEPGT
jgi:2-polyprenyl-6-methoxyphenol hydroxylase-like FAD-dependent oxidoreductase